MRPTHAIPTAITDPAQVDQLVTDYPAEWTAIIADAFWVQYRQPDSIALLDAQGQPVLDAQGNPTTRPVTAADKDAFLETKMQDYILDIVEAYLTNNGEVATGVTTAEKRDAVHAEIETMKGVAATAMKTKRKRRSTRATA